MIQCFIKRVHFYSIDPELSKVEELYIDYGDDITKVRGISDLKNLKDLELEGNGNPNLEELKELKNLKKIELTFRKASSGKFNTNIKAKYMYIYCNKEVKALNLSNIKNIPKVEMEAPGLKKMKMKNNKIKVMSIYNMGPVIQSLKGFGGIETISMCAEKKLNCSNLKGLKTIKLIGIKMKKVSIKNCKNLEYVRIVDMKKLKTLNISNNKKLKKINFTDVNGKYTLKNNKKLENIYLDSCKIKKLDCKQFKNLKKISLGLGRIDKLDFSKCHKLKRIEVNGAKVKSMKIPKKNKIKYLDARDNKLKTINIEYLKKAKTIDLSYNKFSGTFYMPTKVAETADISLSYNKLTKVIFPKKIFVFALGLDHNKIKNVYMNGSELHMYDFRHNPPMTIYDGIVRGGHPHRDKGTKLVNCK